MEREAVLVAIDVGTSKVCALIGEVGRDGRLTIMGHGTVPASGLKKGVVINIDQTVRSIADSVERAERLSGWKIDRAFVGVGGQHVESLNSPGQVAVTAHHREVTREDINRAIEVARAVSIPSNREVLHVERRGFTVDGQEGVKEAIPLVAGEIVFLLSDEGDGWSAVRHEADDTKGLVPTKRLRKASLPPPPPPPEDVEEAEPEESEYSLGPPLRNQDKTACRSFLSRLRRPGWFLSLRLAPWESPWGPGRTVEVGDSRFLRHVRAQRAIFCGAA